MGILEYFDLSLLLLQKCIPTIRKLTYQNRNVHSVDKNYSNIHHLPNNIKEIIIDNNKLDLELYEYVLNKIFMPKVELLFSWEL